MTKIVIDIERCNKCPFFTTENPWSSDGWDHMEDWICKKENKTISKSVEWYDERHIDIPEWCPIKVK